MAERPSPLTPELNALIQAAMVDWRSWANALADAVAKLVTNGGKDPLGKLDEATRAKLAALYDLHGAEFQIRMAGTALDPRAMRKLLDGPNASAVKPFVGSEGASRIVTAYKIGRSHHPTSPTARDVEKSPATLSDAVKRAEKADLTSADKAALEYIQRRGAEYMRRPVQSVIQEIDRRLSDAEQEVVRGAVATGRTQEMGYKRLARELRDSVKGKPILTNDMERVARTESARASHEGALEGLQAKAATLGEDDPKVYKFASPGACVQCRRIWGPNSNPKVYRLSEVRAGDNFGKNPKDWGPTIGPTHPICTCPPVSLYVPEVMEKTQAILADLERKYGR